MAWRAGPGQQERSEADVRQLYEAWAQLAPVFQGAAATAEQPLLPQAPKPAAGAMPVCSQAQLLQRVQAQLVLGSLSPEMKAALAQLLATSQRQQAQQQQEAAGAGSAPAQRRPLSPQQQPALHPPPPVQQQQQQEQQQPLPPPHQLHLSNGGITAAVALLSQYPASSMAAALRLQRQLNLLR